jgi:cullin-associated NEDD8-dissociated protein 1
MSPQPEVFNIAIEHFSDEQEEVRTAAAFAAGMLNKTATVARCTDNGPIGNIAIGNLPQFLPVLVKMVQNDAGKRLLSLHSLKEVC